MALVLVVAAAAMVFIIRKKSAQYTTRADTQNQSGVGSTNAYLGTPCSGTNQPAFSHDLTDSSKINKVTPPFINGGNIQDRAFLWINPAGKKVPIYAPADAELVEGIYKNAKDNLDYDLWFQINCTWWFFINHISDPIDQIKQALPAEPASSTRNRNKISPHIQFKAGDLIGYTTGTNQAHNFDFGVFNLDQKNDLSGFSGDVREYNFICSIGVFAADLSASYKTKIESTSGSVC